ncbi:MAG: hypothetical protein JXB30_18845 [Anaerolineae bacterium]|nr:hypothetical protein [Anaerolineae bacterium]
MKSSRNKQRQKRRRRKRDGAATLSRRVRQRFPNQKLVVGETRDGVKMSEVLREFIAPYRGFANTEEAYRKLLVTAIIAWNAALFSAEERKVHLEKILEILPEEVQADGRAIISELIERKERYFSEYKRMIIDYEVTDTGKDYHLVVISTADELEEG